MDVVKTNVEKISGTIDVESSAGAGTTVRVKIPLTLAIVPALLVSCGGERFAIPQVNVLELVALEDNEAGQRVEQGAWRARLSSSRKPASPGLSRPRTKFATTGSGTDQSGSSIVVLQADKQQFGLVVDDIADTEEIVVKPLSEQLKSISAYSGATIMGDGRVALILDVVGLAQRARVVSEKRDKGKESLKNDAGTVKEGHETLLLARNGLDGQVAIPLSTVARLEGFAAHQVRCVGDREVMEYRGQIIPMIRLSHVLPPGSSEAEQGTSDGSIEVVIYSERGHTVGLIVDCIVDIIDEHAAVDPLATRPGVVGSFANQDFITELLDLSAVVRAAVPGFMEDGHALAAGA